MGVPRPSEEAQWLEDELRAKTCDRPEVVRVLVELAHLPPPDPKHQSPVLSIRARERAWLKVCSALAVEVVRFGFHLREPTDVPAFELQNYPLTDQQLLDLRDIMAKYIRAGTVYEVSNTPRCISPVFLVDKSENGRRTGARMIVDLRLLNLFLEAVPFKLENLGQVAAHGRKFRWMATLDIASAFCHVPVRADHQTLLGIQVNGKYYCFSSCPFGCSVSPYAWSILARDAAALLRRLGIPLVFYVDDLAVFGDTKQACQENLALARYFLRQLGIMVSPTKGHPPAQVAPFLGLIVDLKSKVFRVPTNKAQKVQGMAKGMLRAGRATKRAVLGMAGLLLSLAPACPVARLRARSLFDMVRGRPLEGYLPLSRAARRDLAFWAVFPVLDRARTFDIPSLTVVACSDASKERTAVLFQPLFGSREVGLTTEPLSTSEKALPIAVNELAAVEKGVRARPDLFEHGPRTLVLCMDSTSALGALRNTASRSKPMQDILLRLVTYMARRGHVLKLHWIATELNPADAPSRWQDGAEYQLRPEWFAWIQARLGVQATVDRFASPESALLPRFNTLWPSSARMPVNALLQPWAGEINWANPPFHLLMECLVKCWREGAEAVILVPLWPAEPWWPLLATLADRVCVLPEGRSLFVGGLTHRPLPPPSWGLVAIHIPRREPGADLPVNNRVASDLVRALARTRLAKAPLGRTGRTSPACTRPLGPSLPIGLECALSGSWPRRQWARLSNCAI